MVKGLDIDLSSENWIQDLISDRISGTVDNAASEYLYADIDIEDSFDPIPDFLTYCAGPVTYPPSNTSLSAQPTGSFSSSVYTNLDKDLSAIRHNSTSGEFAGTPAFKDTEPLSWVYETGTRLDFQCFQDPWAFDRIPSNDLLKEQPDPSFSFQSPGGSHDSETYSPDDPELSTGSEGSSTFGCSCYKHVMGHLIKSGVRCGAIGRSNIDGLLACQKDLVLQTEAVLQCKMCSQSQNQANMLMIIIVAIDSLLTILEAAVTPSRASWHDELTETGDTTAGMKKEFGAGFITKLHACPLLVGGFPVPAEEKACFIRQVLQARLSMLLLAVRRIRVCMQQHLTAALSHGRLLMIMDTDRRLQLVMMKIKMAVN
jgi:hypothetical protein